MTGTFELVPYLRMSNRADFNFFALVRRGGQVYASLREEKRKKE